MAHTGSDCCDTQSCKIVVKPALPSLQAKQKSKVTTKSKLVAANSARVREEWIVLGLASHSSFLSMQIAYKS